MTWGWVKYQEFLILEWTNPLKQAEDNITAMHADNKKNVIMHWHAFIVIVIMRL